jgi:hypothetical protein
VAVKTVATIISAAVTRLTRRSVRQRCHTIHDQLQTTTAMASFVSQPWARSRTAMGPSGNGKQRGRQGEGQDAARRAGRRRQRRRGAGHLAADCLIRGARAQPGAFSDGSAQDGPITLI